MVKVALLAIVVTGLFLRLPFRAASALAAFFTLCDHSLLWRYARAVPRVGEGYSLVFSLSLFSSIKVRISSAAANKRVHCS